MKILLLDIETSPNLVWSWGLFNQNISPVQIVEPSRTLCAAWKWYGQKRTYFKDEQAGHEVLIEVLWQLLDDADVVLHFNGQRFDVPSLNKEFLKYRMSPPSPYKHIDLYKVVKKHFRFPSNKLEHLLNELDLEGKVTHTGFKLWKDCLKGNKAAWKLMRKYNIRDVDQMEPLYELLRPWIDSHPNHALFKTTRGICCPNCGSEEIQRRGYAVTKTRKYPKIVCNTCGTWSRLRNHATDNPEHVITQVV